MKAHLKFISKAVAGDAHVLLILTVAGWHVARELKVPVNMTLNQLPASSPALHPNERVWACLCSQDSSNRVYEDYDQMFREASTAWNRLDEMTLASITITEWVRRAI